MGGWGRGGRKRNEIGPSNQILQRASKYYVTPLLVTVRRPHTVRYLNTSTWEVHGYLVACSRVELDSTLVADDDDDPDVVPASSSCDCDPESDAQLSSRASADSDRRKTVAGSR